MTRTITVPAGSTGTTLTLPKQPEAFRLLALCFTVEQAANPTQAILKVLYGGLVHIIGIPAPETGTTTATTITFLRGATPFKNTNRDDTVIAPAPDFTITSDMKVEVMFTGAAGESVSEQVWTLEDVTGNWQSPTRDRR